jgi:hypothetical protein
MKKYILDLDVSLINSILDITSIKRKLDLESENKGIEIEVNSEYTFYTLDKFGKWSNGVITDSGPLGARPETAEDNKTYFATDTEKLYTYLDSVWNDGVDISSGLLEAIPGDLETLIDKATYFATNESKLYTYLGYWPGKNLPRDYNNAALYINNRVVSVLPESTSNNTLITNDGLVVVYYEVEGSKYLIILDIFEQDTALYDEVNPVDYQLLLNHLLDDPIRKRLFMCQTEGSYLIANNDLIYITNNVYHFYSEMDYPELDTDEYGYYEYEETVNDPWLSTYSKITEFKMLKKQFLVIEGPATMEFNGQDQLPFATLGEKKVYLIKYLDIGLFPDSYLNFKLKPTTSAYAGIKIY